MILVLVLVLGRCLHASINRDQRTVFFSILGWYGSGIKKSWVAGGYGSCRSVEIFDRLFLGNLFTH